MVGAGFVWTDLGAGWHWGLSRLKQDGLCFVIWVVVLPDVLGKTAFIWGWGLTGVACSAGRGEPSCSGSDCFFFCFFLWGLWLGRLSFSFQGVW